MTFKSISGEMLPLVSRVPYSLDTTIEAFVLTNKGLMFNVTIEGSKFTKLKR